MPILRASESTALDGVRGLGPPRTAIGVGGGERGEHTGAAEVVERDVVHAGVQERPEQRDAGRDQLQVRTHVAEDADPDRGDLALGVGRELHVLDLAATVNGGHRVLAALLVPANRHLVLAGKGEAEQLLCVHVELAAETATDGRGGDAQLVLGDAERDGAHDLQDVRHLRAGVQRDVAAEGLRHGGNGTGLHCHRQQTLLHVAVVHGVGGRGEGFVDGTLVVLDLEVPLVALVGAQLVVDDHAIAEGILEIDDGSERLVAHVDELDGVASGGVAGGEHHRNGIAHVGGLANRHGIVSRVLHVGRDRPRTRHGSGPQVGEIGTGVGGNDARCGERRAEVDADDACVRVRAAGERQVQCTGQLQVVGVLGFAGEQSRVFTTQQPAPQHGCRSIVGDGHSGTPSTSCGCVTTRPRRRPGRT